MFVIGLQSIWLHYNRLIFSLRVLINMYKKVIAAILHHILYNKLQCLNYDVLNRQYQYT